MALRDENLRLHQVDAGDHFGDGVLDLDARVDFDEIPLLGIDVVEEFDGAGVAVVGFARQANRGFAQLVAYAGREIRCGRDFDDFLMAPLHGTITLVQVQQIAVIVGENLHFQVAGARQIFFQEHAGIAERGARFALRFFEQRRELRWVAHHAHAAPAAAHGGFHDDRVADFLRDFLRFAGGFDGIFGARQHRDTRGGCEPSRGGLVAKQFQQRRRGTYKGDSGGLAGAREGGILGEEAVTWVDGVDASFFGDGNDAGDVQIRFHRTFARADLIRLVGFEAMQAQAVFLGVDRDGANT